MLIKEFFGQKRPVFSFEVFPPKPDYPLETIYQTISELRALAPDYISVTYGAGGSSRGRTMEIARHIKETCKIEALAHLTCVGHTREEITRILNDLREAGVENILALRGDPPKNAAPGYQNDGDFTYASDLISFIKSSNGFSIGAAAYPEGHPLSKDLSEDTNHLKTKVETGVDFLVTQLFLDNQYFFRFMERIRKAGIVVPVNAGIMPVLNANISRIVALGNATVPKALSDLIAKYGDHPGDMEKAGIDYAVRQIQELLDQGVEGIHLYTMNKAAQTREIIRQTKKD